MPAPEPLDAGKFRCPRCGGDERWDPARQALVCASCGESRPPPTAGGPAPAEHDLAASLAAAAAAPARAPTGATLRCESCHAVSQFDAGTAAARCPFCGSTAIAPYAGLGDRFRPEGVVPFATPEADARERAYGYVRRAWLAPNAIKRLARLDTIRGLYLPFWTFDARAEASWEASNGPGATIESKFDDLLVCAEPGLDDGLLAQLEPFPRAAMKPYDPEYVAGWTVYRMRRELDAATALAHARMERELLAVAKRAAPSERKNVRLAGVRYAGETCKQVLLPIWLLDYRYLGRPFPIAVNGATGVVAGRTPVSWIKATLLLLVVGWFILFVNDPATAIDLLRAIAGGLWWLVTRPFR